MKYDYEALEREFIEGPDELSIRALAEKHGITAWSTVNQQAQKREWRRKREEFRAKASSRQIELMADKKAVKIAQIEDDFLKVVHAAILKLGIDLQDRKVKDYDPVAHKEIERVIPGIQVAPGELTKLIATMQTILGKPGAITEERHLGIDLGALGLPADTLREIAAGTAVDDGGTARRASLPGARSAGPN